MQEINSPIKIPKAFALSAAGPYITSPVLPTESQVGIRDGAASWDTGFPPATFIPVAAGGAGPLGQDFNRVLNQISAGVLWQQAGGRIGYDATFSVAHGGYPEGAILRASASPTKLWLSTVDNNLSNPDAAGAGWLPISYAPFPVAPLANLLGGSGSAFVPITLGTGFTLGGIVGDGILAINSAQTEGWYTSTGVILVPSGYRTMFAECWGGGGGASGGVGASGAGGGYAAGYYVVTPGSSISLVIGAGGAGASSGAAAGVGGTTSVGAFCSATGGFAGGAGTGPGGNGFGGTINLFGQCGSDLDGVTAMVVGGAAPRGGGGGGTVNAGGANLLPTLPGGGGGANAANPDGQAGAQGAIYIRFLP